MRVHFRLLPTLPVLIGLAAPALAQEDITFAGGKLRIEENADYEKVVSFDGREIARDYMAFFDRIANISGTEVAMLSIGPGGNACGANTLLIWKNEGDDTLRTDRLPGDCNWPAPAVSDYRIVFVPWVLPGENAAVQSWTPEDGFALAGVMRFAPEPGTGWSELAADPAIYPLDYFRNEAFFAMASSVLGDALAEYATGLGVASDMVELGGGLYAATGCQPHNCGGADSLLVVDPGARTAWFAQIRGNAIENWPGLDDWPAAARGALKRLGDG